MEKKTPWLAILLCAVIILVFLAAGVLIFRRSQKEKQRADSTMQTLDDLDRQIHSLWSDEDDISASDQAQASSDKTETAAEETKAEADELPEIAVSSRETETEGMISILSEKTEDLLLFETETPLTEEEPLSIAHHVIFVGDSRTVGMGKAEAHRADSCTYIGESGEGYRWFIEEGLDQMDTAIRSLPDAPVVFNLGVNDCDHIDAYIEVYKEIEAAYPSTDFYYMSVNPVTKDSTHVPLSDIFAFNRKMRSAFPDQYIDTCSWMIREGFEDVDGVHYSEKQYCRIHDFAVRAVLASKAS